jgi:glycosyltransferase involved in cell wall biosynthesis
MDISIIFATFKRPQVLSRTLESLTHLDHSELSWELFVVDNANQNETAKVIKSYVNRLPLKFMIEQKPGKNHALNKAIPKANGSVFVFTDDDIIADPKWLVELWEGVKRWPEYSVFGGKIIANWPSGIPFWGDNHPLNQSLFSLHYPSKVEKVYDKEDFLPYGPNMAIRRNIFDKGYRYNTEIGPNGSNVYVMGSETELLKRLKNDGYDPVFLPNAIVQHQIRETQLTKKGLNRRNFRIGLSDSFSGQQDFSLFFNAPRYLWKQLFYTWIKYLFANFFLQRIKAFELYCAFWRIKGKIYGNRSKRITSSLIQKLLKLGS